jgi:hypothetical protein
VRRTGRWSWEYRHLESALAHDQRVRLVRNEVQAKGDRRVLLCGEVAWKVWVYVHLLLLSSVQVDDRAATGHFAVHCARLMLRYVRAKTRESHRS